MCVSVLITMTSVGISPKRNDNDILLLIVSVNSVKGKNMLKKQEILNH